MATRFRKSKKIGSMRFTLGKKSVGTSIGSKWFGITLNSRYGLHVRTSIPGTGISFTHKIGGKKMSSQKKESVSTKRMSSNQSDYKPAVIKKSVPHQAWYIIIAIFLLIFGYIGDMLLGLIGGGIMLAFTFATPKTPNMNYQRFKELLRVFDESVKSFMTTDDIETFFSSYSDAEHTSAAMAEMTKAHYAHGKTPQDLVEMLIQEKTLTTNEFLDRYAKAIRMKAYKLTRGRKQKIESFKLITAEYESQMTQESIMYRDQIFSDMLKAIGN